MSDRLIPDSECKQGKCGATTTGCTNRCALEPAGVTATYVLKDELSASQAREAELQNKVKYLELDKQSLDGTAQCYLAERTEALQQVCELQKKLEAAESNVEKFIALAKANEQLAVIAQNRANRAEARIKASQDQNQVCYETLQNYLLHGNVPKLYTAPIIPPDVAELQHDSHGGPVTGDYLIDEARNLTGA